MADGLELVATRPGPKGQTVRVRLSADVAYSLDRFQRTVGQLAELLGCKPCLSGARCHFEQISDWVTNPQGDLVPGPGH
jgi:hypothetical protein